MAQATWVFLVGLPVYLVNTLPASQHPPLGLKDYIALGIFGAGFIFECLADYQKTKWRNQKGRKLHDEKWIERGVWGLSRHPK
jgi:steroid 5-alpha reductase family enzyme